MNVKHVARILIRKRFSSTLNELRVKAGTKLAVALSGGADSVALLALTAFWASSGTFPRVCFCSLVDELLQRLYISPRPLPGFA